ncbi:hypothetical protein GCM10009677_17720 [Sphaerisporangium rubeum]|uniref:Uncharacterized protein n=1 Tax=Sphaerisporangium rubeum TaxID=321317 RepID=A0A7X0IJ21_9ACTN|nr:hypothetical protein [Sphaerisporangium rubeum]MBB6475853.1 hypothetical protein [Sphaerisporangium rubeum]
MPWDLTIFTLDVRQGDSSLVVAENATTGQVRRMLIDGGSVDHAVTAHDAVEARLNPGESLDHVLVSSYAGEHYEGVMRLLGADNLHRIADVIAEVATREAALGNSDREQAAAAAAGAYAACFGGYDTPGGVGGVAARLAPVTTAIRNGAANAPDVPTAILLGYTGAQVALPVVAPLNPALTTAQAFAEQIALVAANDADLLLAQGGFPNGNATPAALNALRTAIREDVLDELFPAAPPGGRFDTGGVYATTQVIVPPVAGDPGQAGPRQAAARNAAWLADAAAGAIDINGRVAWAPGVARTLTTLGPQALGTEILWNSGPAAVPAPAGAPGVFLVAAEGRVWNTTQAVTPGGVSIPQAEGLGVVVRFNDFFHYSGGDLPRDGSERVAAALTGAGLPNPQGGPVLPPAARIASVKCDVHGDDAGTGATFLNTAAPAVAYISAGRTGPLDRSPSQAVVDRLHNDPNVERFYLTNCSFPRAHVPASTGNPQAVLGNKSRVCGDNAAVDGDNRVRGNVTLIISQNNSMNPVSFLVVHRDATGGPVMDQFHL